MASSSISATRLVGLLGSALHTSPAYRGLADGLRLLIADSRVPVGTRLPSERELTAALGVSRTTVARGYAVLREQGYLRSRRGSGSVAALPFAERGQRGSGLDPGGSAGDAIDLTCAAMPAPPGVATAFARAVEELPAYTGGAGYHPQGLPALREAIAARYGERGLPTRPEEVMVTAGALAGVALAARALVGPGDRVLVETPSYPNAVAALRQAGARPVGVPVTGQGWDLEALAAALRQTAPRAALLIPDFHNPTGALMSEAQRELVGTLLRRSRTVALVDETLAELALEDPGGVPGPLARHLPTAVTVGSASKTFWGGLRIGWLRAPAETIARLLQQRLSLDLGAPVVEQLAVCHLMTVREAVLTERRAALLAARDALAAGLREHLPSWGFEVPRGGLSLWCHLPEPLSTAVTVAAEPRGLVLAAGPQFAVDGGLERHLRLPYVQPPEVLASAAERLGQAWAAALQSRSGRSRSVSLVA